MYELDRPTDDQLILRAVQRLAVALVTVEALEPTQRGALVDSSAVRLALGLAVMIRDAMASGASPAQMEGMFTDMTEILPGALEAWERESNLFDDAWEWEVESERRGRAEEDFATLRARLYPDGIVGDR